MDRMDFVDAFKRDLMAAEPRAGALRRLPVPVVVLAGLAIVAIPAWASGLLGKAFPADRHAETRYPGELGRRYVLQTGSASPGHRYRLVAFRQRIPLPRGVPGGGHSSVTTCVELQVTPSVTRGEVNASLGSTCQTAQELQHVRGFYDMGITALGGRRIHGGMLPASVATVRVTWFSGKHVDVVPNRPDPTRLRASHLRFPFTYVAIVPPPGERFKGAEALDAGGHVVVRLRNPLPVRSGEHLPKVHSPLLDLRRYRGEP